ncbi:transglutaminase TgpA family protein [Glaciibacter flavus]|uniref:transglutaminase TgpA family protein n=1 Tax=Orlajensenia flava TaxID=2565934 RepID=UPI003B006A07
MARDQSRFAERGTTYWPLTGALVVLLLTACMALGPVLRNSAWWWGMAVTATVVLVSAAVFRRLRWPVSVVPVGALGVLLVFLTVFFGDGSGLLWVIPTPTTLERFGDLIQAGELSIQQQAVPAVPYPGILFLLCVGAGAIAIVLDTVAITLRAPAIAGALVLIPVAVPALITTSGTDILQLVLVAAAYLLLLRVDVRTRRAAEAANPDHGRSAARSFGPDRRGPGPVWGSLGVAAIAIVSALVLSAATPALSDTSVINSRSNGVLFGNGVSPLIDLGQDLRRPEETLALHYSSDADEHPYLKLLTLDTFSDDLEWVAGHGPINKGNGVDDIGSAPGLTSRIERTKTTTDVQIDNVISSWLPVPYPATSISGLAGNWTWDDTALTVSSEQSTTRNQRYTVKAIALKPTAAQLRDAGTDYPPDIAALSSVPAAAPPVIASTAKEVTAGTTNPYDAAVALQRYLRGNDFAYSTQAPIDQNYDGGSLGVIAKFLEVKKGYCIHFASTMAVMARTLGIPARLALGYLPGESQEAAFADRTRWDVSSHDLHTWPELYFPSVGWVPFEPTTGRGSIPDYALATGATDTSTSAPAAAEDKRPTNQGLLDAQHNAAGSSQAQGALGTWLQTAAIVLGVVVLLLAPLIVRRGIRFVRRRRLARAGPPSLAWREFVDTTLDYGIGMSDTETPRHLADRAFSRPEDAAVRESLERLLVAVEYERYARPDTHPDVRTARVADLDAVLRALRIRASWPVRLRAALLPRSLWPAAFGPAPGTPVVSA